MTLETCPWISGSVGVKRMELRMSDTYLTGQWRERSQSLATQQRKAPLNIIFTNRPLRSQFASSGGGIWTFTTSKHMARHCLAVSRVCETLGAKASTADSAEAVDAIPHRHIPRTAGPSGKSPRRSECHFDRKRTSCTVDGDQSNFNV